MSCEYVVQATRGEYLGPLCSLTGHGCYADQDLPTGHLTCLRRTWANEYVTRLDKREYSTRIAPKSSE